MMIPSNPWWIRPMRAASTNTEYSGTPKQMLCFEQLQPDFLYAKPIVCCVPLIWPASKWQILTMLEPSWGFKYFTFFCTFLMEMWAPPRYMYNVLTAEIYTVIGEVSVCQLCNVLNVSFLGCTVSLPILCCVAPFGEGTTRALGASPFDDESVRFPEILKHLLIMRIHSLFSGKREIGQELEHHSTQEAFL